MTTRSDLLADFAVRYIWWRNETPPSEDRIIAQVMSIGTWDDICRLEAAYSRDELRGVMLRAQPGWISEPSWNLWRGRVRVAGAGDIPESPPEGLSMTIRLCSRLILARAWRELKFIFARRSLRRCAKPQRSQGAASLKWCAMPFAAPSSCHLRGRSPFGMRSQSAALSITIAFMTSPKASCQRTSLPSLRSF
jgi:hypothetical protein